MIAFASSTCVTAAVVLAGWFGFNAHTAGAGENPVREWRSSQTLQCENPQSSRAAALCALLEHDSGPAVP